MNKDQEYELEIMIKDFEDNVNQCPGMGVSNYSFLRFLDFLKRVLLEKKEEPEA